MTKQNNELIKLQQQQIEDLRKQLRIRDEQHIEHIRIIQEKMNNKDERIEKLLEKNDQLQQTIFNLKDQLHQIQIEQIRLQTNKTEENFAVHNQLDIARQSIQMKDSQLAQKQQEIQQLKHDSQFRQNESSQKDTVIQKLSNELKEVLNNYKIVNNENSMNKIQLVESLKSLEEVKLVLKEEEKLLEDVQNQLHQKDKTIDALQKQYDSKDNEVIRLNEIIAKSAQIRSSTRSSNNKKQRKTTKNQNNRNNNLNDHTQPPLYPATIVDCLHFNDLDSDDESYFE